MSSSQGGGRKRPADSSGEESDIRRRIEVDPCRENVFRDGTREFSFRYTKCDYDTCIRHHAEHSCDNGQTMICTLQALDYYNRKNGTEYKVTFAKDSNAFDPGAAFETKNETFCVHVNFTAKDMDQCLEDELFFAELKGNIKPERVISCVRLDGESSREDICIYCTGLKHPSIGGFTGFVDPTAHHHLG